MGMGMGRKEGAGFDLQSSDESVFHLLAFPFCLSFFLSPASRRADAEFQTND